MAAIFIIAGVTAFIWSAFKHRGVYHALIDSFPPEFQDGLSSRFAIHTIALSPSTPLSLQADYVKSLAGFCLAFLCVSLFLFSLQEVRVGFLFLAVTFISAVSTTKSWKTYMENCNRSVTHDDEEES